MTVCYFNMSFGFWIYVPFVMNSYLTISYFVVIFSTKQLGLMRDECIIWIYGVYKPQQRVGDLDKLNLVLCVENAFPLCIKKNFNAMNQKRSKIYIISAKQSDFLTYIYTKFMFALII